MHRIEIKCGLRIATRNFDYSPSVEQIKQDSSLRAELGYGDNIRVMINGTEQPNHVTIPVQVSRIEIETAANTKAN